MKLLLDQGLPRDAVVLLTQGGIEARHVGDLGLSRASDEEILARAALDNHVVVTLDSDFHALLALSGAVGPSAIRLRLDGLRAATLVEILKKTLALTSEALERGALVTVDEHTVRVRKLPIQHET